MIDSSIRQRLTHAGKTAGAALLSAALVVSLSPGLSCAAQAAASEEEASSSAAANDETNASSAADSTVSAGTYVLMNIPYADFYAAEVTNNDVEVDVVTSATSGKWQRQDGTYYESTDDGGQILGVYYLVLVGEGVDVTTLGGSEVDSADDLPTAGDYSYVVIGDAETAQDEDNLYYYYKELTLDESGAAVFGDVTAIDDAYETTTVDVSTTLSTSSQYGDYEIDFQSIGSYVADTVVGMTVYTTADEAGEGDVTGYGLRHLENIWQGGGENSWGSGFSETEKHGNTLSYAHYLSMMGSYIQYIEVDTYTEVVILDLSEALYVAPKLEVEVADATDEDTGTELTVMAYSELDVTYAIDGWADDVSVTDMSEGGLEGNETFPERYAYTCELAIPEGTSGGSYTLTATEDVGGYSAEAEFTVSTSAMPVVWDADAIALVADTANGYTDDDAEAFIANISCVTVNGTAYEAGSSSDSFSPFSTSDTLSTLAGPDDDELPGSSSSSVTIIDEDGSLYLEAEDSDGNAIFGAIGDYEISVEATGYTNTADFTYANSELSDASLSLSSTGETYTGEAIALPSVTVLTVDDDSALVEGTDYTLVWTDESGDVVTGSVTAIGTYTVTVTAVAGAAISGTATATFAVEGISIADADVTLEADAYAYTGEAIEPAVTVTLDGTQLAEGTDYTVSYSDNVSNTTGTVTVTGAGIYTDSASATFEIEIYVMMNIPYADFYESDETIDTSTIDIVSSATSSKWSSRDGTYYESCSGEDDDCLNPSSTGGHILGVTYMVGLGTAVESLDDITTAFADAVEVASDDIATSGDYAYYVLTDVEADGNTYYKQIEATTSSSLPGNLSSGTLTTMAPGGITQTTTTTYALSDVYDYETQELAEVTQLTDTDYAFATSSSYGDYQLDFGTDVETAVAGSSFENTLYAAIVYTADDDGTVTGYAMRQLENIWATSKHGLELSWSVGVVTQEKHGNTVASEHYASMAGQDITSVVFVTSAGVYEVSFADEEQDGTVTETTIEVTPKLALSLAADEVALGTASVTVTVTGDADELTFAFNGEETTATDNGDGTYDVAIPATATAGAGTIAVSADGYVGAEADITLTTDDMPAAWDADAQTIVAADGFTADELAAFIANISSVSVDGTDYATSGRSVVTIVGEDGSIDADASSTSGQGDDATTTYVFDGYGSYTVVVTATGYTQTLSFAYYVMFSDVTDATTWYFDSVYAMADLGVITGYTSGDSAGCFGVGDSMTRAALATIIWRYNCPDEYAAYIAECYDEETDTYSYTSTTDESVCSGIIDDRYWTAAADWCVANGVMQGLVASDGSRYFKSSGTINLATLAQTLCNINGGTGSTASLASYKDAANVPSWATNAVAWAVEQELAGVNTTKLSSRSAIARERVATVLYRAIGADLCTVSS